MLSRLFRSRIVLRLYTACVLSKHRSLRLFGLAFLSIMFATRTAQQWGNRRLKVGVAVAVAAAEAALLTAPLLLLAAAVAGSAALVTAVAALPDDDTGHRGGAEGFDGPHCENTVEAALALLEREAQEGPLPRFPYLEFDVQETADGELIVFHDSLLTRAFPAGGANAAAIDRIEAHTGAPFSLLTVQDLTAAQLQSLALGGRPGVHVPTLQQFLDACDAAGATRSLAVEIKVLRTDAARQRFVDAVASYRQRAAARLDGHAAAVRPSCRQLGGAGVISFPHHFAACFGEYGSAEWARWASEFRTRGIPVRACHCLFLSLVG